MSKLSKLKLLAINIATIIVVLYVAINTIILWYHAGLIMQFIAANLFTYIGGKVISKALEELK
jgi:hypothetical protein